MKIMPKSTKDEKLRWIKPILNKELTIKKMAEICPFSERSLKYWIKAFKEKGLEGLENKSTRPKSHPNETNIRMKERIIEIRKDSNLCARKIMWELQDEDLHIHERTIGKILNQDGLVRKYRTKKIKYDYIKIQLQPGEIIEIDVKYVPGKFNNNQYFQYTAIDVASRWRFLKIYDSQTTFSAMQFLKEVIKRFPHTIVSIKTDNHSTFTNRYTGYLKSSDPMNPKLHSLDLLCNQLGIMHYLIDPGKPTQNGTVERSHRSDQETFYNDENFDNIEELKMKISLWNLHYNNRLKHCSLNGLTPNQALIQKVQNVYA